MNLDEFTTDWVVTNKHDPKVKNFIRDLIKTGLEKGPNATNDEVLEAIIKVCQKHEEIIVEVYHDGEES
jgi:hypothetical protein